MKSIAWRFAESWKYKATNKQKLKHRMLVTSKAMRMNGTDKLYTFKDRSELQVREMTCDWQLFKEV